MKKIFSIILVAILLLVFVSCTPSDDLGGAAWDEKTQKTYPISSESKYYSIAADLPDIVFSTSGSENKLIGNVYKFQGTVTGFDEMEMGTNTPPINGFFVETKDGTVIVQNFMGYLSEISTISYAEMCGDDNTDYTMPELKEDAIFICLYTGFSGKYNMPIFYYGCDEALVEQIYLDFQSEQENATKESNGETDESTGKLSKTTETEIVQEDENLSGALTNGQKNALSSAYDYISVMSFSYDGLIEQLEYEGFSTEDATYAADACGADWNEQAVASAKGYLDIFDFSRSKLIEQLEFDGFTHAQAVYAADQLGL